MTASVTQRTTTRTKMPSNQSLNHLLNFTLAPRQSQPVQALPRRSRKPASHQALWHKEKFVNAQYRFVMNPTESYAVHFADPDIFFQWQDILQVIIPLSSAMATAAAASDSLRLNEGHISCPICLAKPIAPRMTKCGHVFCYPCILHYFSTSDDAKWVRCPICFDAVNEKQLKSVKWYDGFEPNNGPHASSSSSSAPDPGFSSTPIEGSSMRMRLMQRPQITTLALPRSPTWPSDLIPPHQAPFHFLPSVYSFAKFMLATPDYLIADLTKEVDELCAERRILKDMGDELGLVFVDGAEQRILHQIALASALESAQLKDSIGKTVRELQDIEDRAQYRNRRQAEAEKSPLDVPHELLATDATAPAHPTLNRASFSHASQSQSSTRGVRPRRNINPPPPSTSSYYFYQAASGLPIFLHPLDIRILLSHFKSYSSFPDTITVRVEAVSEGTVDDDLRKCCKYLSHLAEGGDVVFIEADLEGVVGSEALKPFEGHLRQRRAKRKEKGRKDDRARARAEEREREKERANIFVTWNSAGPTMVVPQGETDILEGLDVETSSPPPPAPIHSAGAWGARSFASALHSHGQPGAPRARPPLTTTRHEDDDGSWDVDAAWHAFESGDLGRKKKSNRLVVLGSGGGRRR